MSALVSKKGASCWAEAVVAIGCYPFFHLLTLPQHFHFDSLYHRSLLNTGQSSSMHVPSREELGSIRYHQERLHGTGYPPQSVCALMIVNGRFSLTSAASSGDFRDFSCYPKEGSTYPQQHSCIKPIFFSHQLSYDCRLRQHQENQEDKEDGKTERNTC